MGRNKKSGLDYFPHDVEMHDNFKVRLLMYYHGGGNAYAVYISLLEFIYKAGYYIKVDRYLIFNLSSFLKNNDEYDEIYIKEVIDACVENELFNRELYSKHNILTSRGIQHRYIKIATQAHRIISVDEPFWLDEIIDEFNLRSNKSAIKSDKIEQDQTERELSMEKLEKTTVNSEEMQVSFDFSAQIKENKIKRKERKDNDSLRSSLSPTTPPTSAHARKSFGDEKGDCDHDDPMTANEGVGILKTDKDWLLQVQRKFALDKSIILGWLDSFCNDCNCRGKQQHENLADVKQHFIDWMSKQLNSKNNKKTCKEKVIKITPEKIWLRCQAELSQSVSDEITKQTIESLIFENYDAKSSILLLDVPNRKCSEYIEENCITTLTKVLQKHFGKNIKLNYRLPEYP